MSSLHIQDSNLNGVRVFLCLWMLGWVLYKLDSDLNGVQVFLCLWTLGLSSLHIQDSDLNEVWVFLCLWTLGLSSLRFVWYSPSLHTRPPQPWLGCSHFSGISNRRNLFSPTPLMEGSLLCIPDLSSSSRSNTGTNLDYNSRDLCEKVNTWEGYLEIHKKISTQLYKAHI